MSSREHTNFTYDLNPRSLAYLAAFFSVIFRTPIWLCQGYLGEILLDQAFAQHVREATLRSHRRRISDPVAHIGQRAGWYALVRALKPDYIVETETDKGLGSVVSAAAVIRNGSGHITTVDINDESGLLFSG